MTKKCKEIKTICQMSVDVGLHLQQRWTAYDVEYSALCMNAII